MDPDGRYPSTGKFMVSAEDTAHKIVKEHGKKCETYKTANKTAKEYLKGLKPEPEYESNEWSGWNNEKEDQDAEFLRSILKDYQIMARKEFEYHESEEYIQAMMEANDYHFTKDGKRFG